MKARRKPNAIPTRALMHAGRGHKFWIGFPADGQAEIEKLAHEIHEVLFKARWLESAIEEEPVARSAAVAFGPVDRLLVSPSVAHFV